MNKISNIVILISLFVISFSANAGGKEDFNDCRTTRGNMCERAGSCAIQSSAWYQYVTIDKSSKFDKQGWPGLCDMVHVSLVQSNCSPLGVQDDITAYLSSTTSANIPSISGLLACGGDVPDDNPIEICNDGFDNDNDGKTDCSDKRDCRRDSFCL